MGDIANSSGVSVSTVSRILNDTHFACSETRNRVMQTVKELGYSRLRRRNARVLPGFVRDSSVNSEMKHIVLLASASKLHNLESSEWIYRDIVPVLQRLSREKGFHLSLSSYECDDRWTPPTTLAKHVDGVLWMGDDHESLLSSIGKRVPIVAINVDSLWPPQTRVVTSERMVMYKAVEHLASLGHRRIGYFNCDLAENNLPHRCRDRLLAYREAIFRLGLDCDNELCLLERFGMNEHPQAVARAMNRLLAIPSPPTSLIAPLKYSIEFLRESRKRGICVPFDLSIVAIDNAMAAECVDPALTVVDCVLGKCAKVAVDLLLGSQSPNIRHRAILSQTIYVEPRLIVRDSTATISTL